MLTLLHPHATEEGSVACEATHQPAAGEHGSQCHTLHTSTFHADLTDLVSKFGFGTGRSMSYFLAAGVKRVKPLGLLGSRL